MTVLFCKNYCIQTSRRSHRDTATRSGKPIELRYSLAQAIVPPGQVSIPHSLTTSEVYYILSGVGEMHIDQEVKTVVPGDAIYIPPNAKQFIANRGEANLIFICIVDPAWRKQDETIYRDLPDSATRLPDYPTRSSSGDSVQQ